MKRGLFALLCALPLVGCTDFKGHVTMTSQSPDGELTATVSREGEYNSRDAVYHVYLAATNGGAPEEVDTITKASFAYVRWESNSLITILFNGGMIESANFFKPVTIRIGSGKRVVGIQITNDFRRPD